MQQVDPLTYPDWNACLSAAPYASIFHTTNWLRVLQEAYGYRPYYFACFKAQQLTALLPFMEVKSWVTGVRGVSLPFSDYCEPITATQTVPELLAPVIRVARQRQWKSLEIRGGGASFYGISPYVSYARHSVVLHGDEAAVFSGLRSNYRAKIRKALESDLTVTLLRSPEAMAEYYRLHCLTRKRHGLPPQPVGFFGKIQEHIIANNLGFVILVSHQGRNVAGAIFFTFGSRAMYKFGASDLRYQHLHANYLLFWHAMQWLCRHGYAELCFGRTDPGNTGLMQFKEGWGAGRSQIAYYRYDLKTASFAQDAHGAVEANSALWKKMPITLLRWAGAVLYRHMG